MPDVRRGLHGGPADVDRHPARFQGDELARAARGGVMQSQAPGIPADRIPPVTRTGWDAEGPAPTSHHSGGTRPSKHLGATGTVRGRIRAAATNLCRTVRSSPVGWLGRATGAGRALGGQVSVGRNPAVGGPRLRPAPGRSVPADAGHPAVARRPPQRPQEAEAQPAATRAVASAAMPSRGRSGRARPWWWPTAARSHLRARPTAPPGPRLDAVRPSGGCRSPARRRCRS